MKVSRYFDSNALKTLTNAGNDTVIEYIKMYLEQTSLEINQLQKLDVLNDWKHISLIAHNLKSKAKYMGVSQLAMIAEELEITVSTSKSQFSRAKAILREIIEKQKIGYES